MKKCLSISCILLAVVTMFSLYCYRERENKNLVASIEPYTETAVILSDYVNFEKSIYIGHKSDHEILYKNYADNYIRSVDINTQEQQEIIKLDTQTNGTMTTFAYKDNWFVWSESQDAELRVGSSIGENWAVYAANLCTGEIIFVDGENDFFPKTRNFDPHPWSLSINGSFVVYASYTANEDGIYPAIKIYDLNNHKLEIADTADSMQTTFGSPSVNDKNVVYLKFDSNGSSLWTYDIEKHKYMCIEPPEPLQEICITNSFIVGVSEWQPQKSESLYCYDFAHKKWSKQIDTTTKLYPTNIDSTLEFAELQSSNDFITWRPITGNTLYVWDITTNKILDLSENVSGLIDYVLNPFDEDYLVWCETDTLTQETKYPCIKISSES